jgi:UDP-N-acetylglucosamine--N-acetylmuramyl-(pentapeptide) pyrophosphoryl-undecaprenol N-acetylglucosamine transferase
VVTLGTYRGYSFVRLVRRLLEVLPPDAELMWQTGDTDTSGLGSMVTTRYWADLIDAMREADVVLARAGVGTAPAALEVGKCPVLVPRRLAHGEHVDDHQSQTALELARRGLSASVES